MTPSGKRASPLFRGIGRLGGFGASVVLVTAVNLAAIPTVIIIAGADEWSGIAVAQALAALATVVVAFGWGVSGAAETAALLPPDRGQYFADSVGSRLWLFIAVLPILLIAVWALAPENHAANTFAALAVVIPAIGASWFFVGEARPWRLFSLDSVPRALGTVVGLAALAVSHNVVLFTVAQAIGALVAVFVSGLDVLRRTRPYSLSLAPRASFRRLALKYSSIVMAATATLYGQLPLILVAAFAPTFTPAYAAADKLLKVALAVHSPFMQVAQGYVPRAGEDFLRPRARQVALAAVAVAVAGGTAYALLMPLGVRILSGGSIRVGPELSVPMGTALGAIAVSVVIGLACLASFGEMRLVAKSTLIGAAFGIPAMILGGYFYQAIGIAWAAAALEVFVASYQLAHLRRILRRSDRSAGSLIPRSENPG